MRAVDIKAVLKWNPCEDFPPERIRDLFDGRRRLTFNEIMAIDMRQDEKLWAVLREAFFCPEELERLALSFLGHVCDLSFKDEVSGELQYAVCALEGRFDLLPADDRQDRWANGATDSERSTALTALWAATARANSTTDSDERLARWREERDWQVEEVRREYHDS